MSTLVALLFSFSGIVSAMAAAAVWLWLRPASAAARRCVMGLVLGVAIASTYSVPYGVGRLLSVGYRQVQPSDLPAGKTAVVVLGSADAMVANWNGEQLSTLDVAGAARVWEAFAVYRLIPDSWLISSGGPAGGQRRGQSSAVTMRDALVAFGVPAPRIMIEETSLTTRDEAVLVAAMLRTLGTEHVVLVTSDIHMRRSVGAFAAAGVTVIPAIARDPFLSRPWRQWLLPTAAGFEQTRSVIHEIVGIGYYSARGWFRRA